ncbi:MAG TPA: response regulator transcription factor [Edaphobacter sp.]|nr:response regulator transcription factor [Edaphobacter sp.]
MNSSILLIDDDVELCESLTCLLEMEQIAVTSAHNIARGKSEAWSKRYDLVVLDVMLPDGDGRVLLQEIRERFDVPVIMLTARGDAGDRIAGLENGADDYIPKPFIPGELVARIRAVLRRRFGGKGNTLMAGDLKIEISARRVLRNEQEIVLTSAEFDILLILLRRSGECVTRDELTEQVLGRPVGVSDRAIDNHISSLRRKLGAQAGDAERIRSIRHLGYCYTGFPHA